MTDYPTGPESGATPGSELWDEPECVRPMGVLSSEAKRAGALASVTPSAGASVGGASDTATPPPSLPIWPPDEWNLLLRVEALEAHVANLESVLAMAVQVANTAADIARGRAA